MDFFGKVEKEVSLPDLVFDLEEIGESPQRDDIDGPRIPTRDSDGQTVNYKGIPFKEFLKCPGHLSGVFHLSEVDGGRIDLLSVEEDLAPFLHPVEISQSLQKFK